MARKWWLNALAAGFPSLVGIQTISNLYLGNAGELGNDAGVMTPGILTCAFLWLVLFLALQYGRFAGKVIWSVVTAYTLFYIIRDVFFPLPLEVLDGTDPLGETTTGYVAIEMTTLLTALVVLIWLPVKISLPLNAMFAAIFAISTIVTFAGHKVDSGNPNVEAARKIPSAVLIPKTVDAPNVYHIIFDEYQTVLYEAVRKIEGDHGPFEDFIFFRNNVSNYNRTFIALPGLFLSHLYQSDEDWKTWQKGYLNRGLFKMLKERGYGVSVYGHSQGDWPSAYIDYVHASQDIGEEAQNGANIQSTAISGDFGTLLRLRLLPSFVGKHEMQKATALEGKVIPPANDWAYYASMMFRELISQLKHQSPQGNYVFVHLILPHAPYVLDSDGHYVGPDKNKANVLTHTLFVDKLMGEFNNELRRLGRYHDSLIVVHADTGSYIDRDLSKSDLEAQRLASAANGMSTKYHWRDGAKWTLECVEARAQAILLIKPPHHKGYLVDNSPTSLLDIAPTIAEVVGIDRLEFEGMSLINERPDPDRLRHNYVLGKKIGGFRVKHMQEYLVRNNEFHRGVLVPTGE